MVQDFCAYGNENYLDTVTKAIPAFFRYYDVRFMPQETLITMDYPTICPIIGKSGIDAIESYLEYISLEQTFMNALPREYVYGVLFKFQANYRKQFYNICTILLRHILGHMMIGKSLGEEGTKEDYELIQAMLLNNDPNKIEMRLLLQNYVLRHKMTGWTELLYYNDFLQRESIHLVDAQSLFGINLSIFKI